MRHIFCIYPPHICLKYVIHNDTCGQTKTVNYRYIGSGGGGGGGGLSIILQGREGVTGIRIYKDISTVNNAIIKTYQFSLSDFSQ